MTGTEIVVSAGQRGRPRTYTDDEADIFQDAIDDYFNTCDAEGKPYTIPGLAYHLGFNSKQTLYDYESRGEEGTGSVRFSGLIKRARLRIESQRAGALVEAKHNPAGMIFDLKNNFGWKDTQDQAGAGGVTVVINAPTPEIRTVGSSSAAVGGVSGRTIEVAIPAPLGATMGATDNE